MMCNSCVFAKEKQAFLILLQIPFMSSFLPGTIQLFKHYKNLAEKTLAQVSDASFFQQQGSENSMAVIVQHMAGNMKSRFTDFLTTDGEKPWRNRDGEFEAPTVSRAELMTQWEGSWKILLDTLENLSEQDLSTTVYIRNEGHSVPDAMLRQLAHYSYHVGQLVHAAKLLTGERWEALSIPKGASDAYNAGKFAQPKGNRHFTEQL